jgi:hypothetical protein
MPWRKPETQSSPVKLILRMCFARMNDQSRRSAAGTLRQVTSLKTLFLGYLSEEINSLGLRRTYLRLDNVVPRQ